MRIKDLKVCNLMMTKKTKKKGKTKSYWKVQRADVGEIFIWSSMRIYMDNLER